MYHIQYKLNLLCTLHTESTHTILHTMLILSRHCTVYTLDTIHSTHYTHQRLMNQHIERYQYFFLVQNIFDTDTFSGIKSNRNRYQYFFPVPNICNSNTNTFYRYKSVTVPQILNDTDNERFFPVPNIPDTDTCTFFGTKFF